MRKDCLQLANNAISSCLNKLLGLLDAGRVFGLEGIFFFQKLIDKLRLAPRESLDQIIMSVAEDTDIDGAPVFRGRLDKTLGSIF